MFTVCNGSLFIKVYSGLNVQNDAEHSNNALLLSMFLKSNTNEQSPSNIRR